jgi:hypothetical protein
MHAGISSLNLVTQDNRRTDQQHIFWLTDDGAAFHLAFPVSTSVSAMLRCALMYMKIRGGGAGDKEEEK